LEFENQCFTEVHLNPPIVGILS